jgi:eukaryotic-like serine/threonine-protein kinase
MMNSQILAERMTAGRLPAAEAIRLAAVLADRLRQLHDDGRTHGALTPSAIVLSDSGVELLPPAESLTPYTAPEVGRGVPADRRSDIFSFGAIFYEMLTGRRAFEDAGALLSAAPRPTGSAAVDRLVAACVAKSPDSRFQRVQRLQLELRLLTRRAAPVQPAAVPAPFPVASRRSEIEALEARIAERFQEQERSIAGVERVANEVLQTLRGGPVAVPARPAPRRYAATLESDSSAPHMNRAFELLSEKVARIDLTLGSFVERLQKLEGQLDAFDTDAAALRDSVTRDIRNFERALKGQSTAIESARTAMGQTDDLVERVVEALDSLQSMFITSAEELAAS